MLSKHLSLIPLLLATASAASFDIDVGEDGLSFEPTNVTAAVGDTVTFHFYPRNHSVAQSAFSSPCNAMANGFFSGYIPSSSGESKTTFTVTIDNTDPKWFYCTQVDHCQSGMVGVINPPSSSDTLEAYKSAAANAQTTTPQSVTGGALVSENDSSSAPLSSSSVSASSAVSSATSSASSAASSASVAVSSSASAAASSASAAGSSVASSASAAASTGAAAVLGADQGGVVGMAGIAALLLLV